MAASADFSKHKIATHQYYLKLCVVVAETDPQYVFWELTECTRI